MREDIQKIMVLRDLKFTDLEISEMLGISKTSVQIKMRNQNEIDIKECDRRRNEVEDLFFHTIDSEIKAYLLGFIMADGCVFKNRIEMSVLYEDKYILELLQQYISKKAGITPTKNNKYAHISILSRQISKDLYDLNVTERKSLTLEPPPDDRIPGYLYHHMVRGYFDGDGSIWFDDTTNNFKMNIVSTKPVLEKFREKMGWKKNTIRYANKGKYITCRMDYSGNRVLNNYLSQIYEDAHFYLERKYDKYLKVKQLCNKKT